MDGIEMIFNNYFIDCSIVQSDIDSLVEQQSIKSKIVLNDVICEFIRRWPKWQVIKKKNDYDWAIQEYLSVFKRYLTSIVDAAVKHIKEIEGTRAAVKCIDGGCQTESVKSYISIDISGPLKFISNSVFTADGDDVLAIQHFEKPWNGCFQFPMFLNTPYAYYFINLPSISITRVVVPEVERYLTRDKLSTLHKPQNTNSVWNKLNPQKECVSYTYKNMLTFVEDFAVATKYKDYNGEITMLIKEALLDVKEYFCRFVTNTRAISPMCKNTYARSKRHSDSSNFLNYYEVIAPTVKLMVHHFYPDSKTLRQTINTDFTNAITFRCNLCMKSFVSLQTLQVHFKNTHVAEEAVLCNKCGIKLAVEQLVIKRWKHNCSSN